MFKRKNCGTTDRVARVVIGVAIGAAYLVGWVQGTIALVAGLFSLMLIGSDKVDIQEAASTREKPKIGMSRGSCGITTDRRATIAASHEVTTRITQISAASIRKLDIWICFREPNGTANTRA